MTRSCSGPHYKHTRHFCRWVPLQQQSSQFLSVSIHLSETWSKHIANIWILFESVKTGESFKVSWRHWNVTSVLGLEEIFHFNNNCPLGIEETSLKIIRKLLPGRIVTFNWFSRYLLLKRLINQHNFCAYSFNNSTGSFVRFLQFLSSLLFAKLLWNVIGILVALGSWNLMQLKTDNQRHYSSPTLKWLVVALLWNTITFIDHWPLWNLQQTNKSALKGHVLNRAAFGTFLTATFRHHWTTS